MMSIARRVFLFAATTMLLSHGATAQSPARVQRVALKGYDPVAYFTEGKPVQGSAAHSVVWDEARWHFASAKNLELFRVAPDRYTPQFGGSCAMRMSGGEKVEADPKNWLIQDGKLFVFATPSGPSRFLADNSRRDQAAENWKILQSKPTRR